MHRAAAEVLAREQYAGLEPTLLDRLWSEVLGVVGRVIDLVGQTGQAGIVGTILVVAILALVVYAAVRLLRRVRPSAVRAAPGIELAGRSAADWIAEARAHEREGRWREAVRCHHRALIAELAAAGLVEEVPGRTAAEYEAEVVEAVGDAATAMAQATRLFEQAWYTDVPLREADVEVLQRAAAEILRAAGLRIPAGRP